jgi:polyisoprenoid-binding protein YceI
MYKLILVALIALSLNAETFKFSNGKIEAHTEVFGDSTINPVSQYVKSQLSFDDSIESLHGTIIMNTLSLKSDNSDRDKHMYETLHSEQHPIIQVKVTSLEKIGDQYKVNAMLTLNGIEKPIESIAEVQQQEDHLILKGGFSFLLTNFDLEPPTLVFLTVRDQIDIKYNLFYLRD